MKYRGALIGLGNIAMRGHLPAWTGGKLKKDTEIVAVMDLVDMQKEAVRTFLPHANFYTDVDLLLESEKLDFVDICTPPFTHAQHIRACVERNLHIVCEKPLTEQRESASEVERLLADTKMVFMPCHQYKYSPLWRAIHDVVASGALGRVTLAQFNVFRLKADTGTVGWNPSWRINKRQSGGGILTDTGAHYFYLIQYLFGMPLNVTAVLRTLKHSNYTVEDTAVVMLDYDDKLVQINLTWAAHQRANSALVTGTEGSLSYDGTRLLQTIGDNTTEIPMPDISDKNQYIQWYADMFHEFVNRIGERNFSKDMLEESVNVMDLLERSYRSSKQHAWLEV